MRAEQRANGATARAEKSEARVAALEKLLDEHGIPLSTEVSEAPEPAEQAGDASPDNTQLLATAELPSLSEEDDTNTETVSDGLPEEELAIDQLILAPRDEEIRAGFAAMRSELAAARTSALADRAAIRALERRCSSLVDGTAAECARSGAALRALHVQCLAALQMGEGMQAAVLEKALQQATDNAREIQRLNDIVNAVAGAE